MSFIVFAFATLPAHSQKIRFTDTTNHWIPGHTYFSGTTFSDHQFSGSTNVNGLNYLILNGQLGYNYLVREDTVERKVYYREYQSSQPIPDSNEYIGYDYNWQVGDTVTRWIAKWTGKVPAKYVVATIDSVVVNNIYHKVWSFSYVSGTPFGTVQVIEGIGSVAGPTWLFNLPDFFEGGMALYCFMTNNTKPVLNFLPFNNTHSCAEGVDDDKALGNSKVVFPNPVARSSYLKVGDVKTANLVIWNVSGQEVYKRALRGNTNLPIGELIQAPGIYFYRVADYSATTERHYEGSFIRE
jgi:hypothetical protein